MRPDIVVTRVTKLGLVGDQLLSGVSAMTRVVWICVGMSVALVFPAAAFQEETVAPVAGQSAGEQVQIVGDAATQTSPSDTAISLPGLGNIGSLPKLDFGLELLYGASDDAVGEADDPSLKLDEDGELTIKGRARYNF